MISIEMGSSITVCSESPLPPDELSARRSSMAPAAACCTTLDEKAVLPRDPRTATAD